VKVEVLIILANVLYLPIPLFSNMMRLSYQKLRDHISKQISSITAYQN